MNEEITKFELEASKVELKSELSELIKEATRKAKHTDPPGI